MSVNDTTDVTAVPTTPPSSGVCPVCDATAVNGQGLYTCSECDWTGTV